MTELKDCGVIFDPIGHTYTLEGFTLSGVTGRIRQRICPDEYAAVDEATLQAAAERGNTVHAAIQRHDDEGWRPGFEEVLNQPLFAAVDFYEEIMRMKCLTTVANEHLVTDGHDYASAIDVVAEDMYGKAVIIDIKTTYNLNREYVSWQLSTYAMMLEMANPGIDIARLACLWVIVRGGIVQDVRLIDLPRKSVNDVKTMLYTEDELVTGLEGIDEELALLNKEREELDGRIEELRKRMEEDMVAKGLTSWKSANATYSYRPAGTTTRFDCAAFKKAQPDMYTSFSKSVDTKPTLSIRFACG